MSAMRIAVCALILAPLLALCSAPAYADPGEASGSAAALSVHAVPETVAINLNYGGAQVALSGLAPAGAQIAIKVSAADADVQVSKKGKVLGFIWMTVERVSVENTPGLYAVYSSTPLQDLLGADDLTKLGLDPSLNDVFTSAVVKSSGYENGAVPPAEAKQFVSGLRDIRASQGLYYVREDGISLDGENWQASLSLPAAAPPGDYTVTAYAIADKQVVSEATSAFSVQKAGAVSFLGSLAHDNPSLYGMLAIVGAVGIGLVVGRIFGGGGH